jgi:nitrite reductase/ring-hydroxylating ferredoxin subunit
MGLFARIFGICKSRIPGDPDSWRYSQGEIHAEPERISELSNPGSSVRLEGKGLSQKILLVYGTDGNFYAFENKCTHMGRRLDALGTDKSIQCCSISKSTYDYTGRVVSGPAKGSLKSLPLEMKDGRVIIFLGKEN